MRVYKDLMRVMRSGREALKEHKEESLRCPSCRLERTHPVDVQRIKDIGLCMICEEVRDEERADRFYKGVEDED